MELVGSTDTNNYVFFSRSFHSQKSHFAHLCQLTTLFLLFLRKVPGDYKIMINIEDDEVTCNSYVVFSQMKKENFIYVDRHGNWVVGEIFKIFK